MPDKGTWAGNDDVLTNGLAGGVFALVVRVAAVRLGTVTAVVLLVHAGLGWLWWLWGFVVGIGRWSSEGGAGEEESKGKNFGVMHLG